MTPSCESCKRQLEVGESAWADDWQVFTGHDGEWPTGWHWETRYTCDDCEEKR